MRNSYSPLNGYYQVKNAQVVHNTIVDCVEPISIGVGKSTINTLTPENNILAYNLILPKENFITWYDQPKEITFKENIFSGNKSSMELPEGNIQKIVSGKKDKWDIWRPNKKSTLLPEKNSEFAFVNLDIDNQERSKFKNIGADQVKRKKLPMLKESDVGPKWMNLKPQLFIKDNILFKGD